MVSATERQRSGPKSEMREVFGDSEVESEDPDEEESEEGESEEDAKEISKSERISKKVLGRVGKGRQMLRPPSSDESESDSENDSQGGDDDANDDGGADDEEDVGRAPRKIRGRTTKKISRGKKQAVDSSESDSRRGETTKTSKKSDGKSKGKRDNSTEEKALKRGRAGRVGPPRAKKPRNSFYSDDSDLDEDGEQNGKGYGKEEEDLTDGSESEKKQMEKILAWRVKQPKDQDEVGTQSSKDQSADEKETATGNLGASEANPEYEYLVKWKNKAYIHCEWVGKDVILAQPQGKGRLQRFERKEAEKAQMREDDENENGDEEPIPEDFCSVERIIAERISKTKKKRQYLVKWRALQHSEATWEYEEDVKDDEKISAYQQRNEMPKAELLKTPVRNRDLKFTTQPNPKLKSGGELREYQLEGYNWLISCWFRGQGSILADEMGLGKTIQSVAFCHYLYNDQKIRGPFLVVAPLSTLGHWQREFDTWTWLNAIVYHGNSQSRDIIHKFEWTYSKQSNTKGPPYKWHALITTYETILQEASRLRGIKWNNIVVDEAHRLKNRSSKLIEELRNFNSQHRILLTGTPIQNTSLEVWSLLNFLDPEKFADEADFAEKFGDVKDSTTVQTLKDTLRPFMLRRLKEDVEKSIPPKEETIVSVELTRVQKKWYRALLEQNFSFLEKAGKASNVGNLRNIVMELRKCCNHPYLIRGVEQIEMEDKPPDSEEETNKKLIEASGKLVLVDKLLPRLKEEGHKVLIFSQMIRVLDILEDYLISKRWGYERIDGHARGNDRQQAIDRFSKPGSEKFVFLLCTRAGGQGINLTVADTVIIYDSDWNPQNDVQAQARCHRIGQKKDVKIYRLITRGTYEMDMFDKASKKLGLDQAVLQNMGIEKDNGSAAGGGSTGAVGILNELKREEVDSLLRKGAYDVFNEDDSAADAFTSEDINSILERRTTLVRTGSEQVGPSAFSKATFQVEEGVESNLDVNDPDFWRKIMPNGPAAPDPNIQFQRRRRRQTVRYVPQEQDQSSGDEPENDSSDEVINGESPSGKPLWNKEERKRLYKGLMSFGWGRWKEVGHIFGLSEKRSLDEIAMATRNMIRLAMQNCSSGGDSEEENGNTNKSSLLERCPILQHPQGPHRTITETSQLEGDGLEALEDEDVGSSEQRPWIAMTKGQYREGAEVVEPLFIEPVLTTSDYGNFLSRNANHMFDRLDLLCSLQYLSLSGELDDDNLVPTVGGSGNQALGDWWDKTFDRHLLLGTIKHGYGNYPPMRTDSELIFLGRSEPIEEDSEEDDEEEEEDVEEEEEEEEGEGEGAKERKQAETSASKKESGSEVGNGTGHDGEEATVKKSTKTKVETKSKQEDEEKEKMDVDTKQKLQKVSKENGTKSGSPVDGEEEGGGSDDGGENKSDAEEKDSKEHSKKKGKNVVAFIPLDEMQAREWPSVPKLNSRVKKLIRAYVRQRKKVQRIKMAEQENERARRVREEQRLAKLEEQRSVRERKQYLLSITWTKREKQDFARYFSFVGGAPLGENGEEDWNAVLTRAKLPRKTPQTVSEYAQDYLKMCQQASEVAMDMQGKPNGYNDPAKTKEAESASKEDDNAEKFTPGQLEEARVTPANAKRFLERFELLKAIRQLDLDSALVTSRLEKYMRMPKRDGLPGWWNEAALKYDIEILKAIRKDGFDTLTIPLENPVFHEACKNVLRTMGAPPLPQPQDVDSASDDPNNSEQRDSNNVQSVFPKDRSLLTRVQSLLKAAHTVEKPKPPPEPVTGPSSLPPPVPEEPAVAPPSGRKRKLITPRYEKVEGGLLRMEKIICGEIGYSFEIADDNRLTRNVLKALRRHKKSSRDATARVNLPDWVTDNEAFRLSIPEVVAAPPKLARSNSSQKFVQTTLVTPSGKGKGQKRTAEDRPKGSQPPSEKPPSEDSISLPMKVGAVTVENLGDIVTDRRAFRTDRLFFPVGFRSRRAHASMSRPEVECDYISEVVDGGSGPQFRVTCMDLPNDPISTTNPSATWATIIRATQSPNNEEDIDKISHALGAEYFGLSNPLVVRILKNRAAA